MRAEKESIDQSLTRLHFNSDLQHDCSDFFQMLRTAVTARHAERHSEWGQKVPHDEGSNGLGNHKSTVSTFVPISNPRKEPSLNGKLAMACLRTRDEGDRLR
ncbi:hypothetical protein Mapa_006969 [Marchantia paleacea]|nr:hypothetical protein Mapa_006969 [Marchantia paleacea]